MARIIKIGYVAEAYPETEVTGLYGRVQGSKKKGYTYFICETMDARRNNVPGLSKKGTGPTLRELEVSPDALPAHIREMLEDKYTHRIGDAAFDKVFPA